MSQEEPEKEMDKQKFSEKSVPDLYVNSTELQISIYDVQINFGIRSGSEEVPKDVAIIRMSPQHALAMSKLLLKNLRVYEEQVGKIYLPQNLLEELGIEGDDSDEVDA